jgi:hypothetical protein
VLLQHERVSGSPLKVAFWGFIETTPYLCTTFPHLLFPRRSLILYNNPGAIKEKAVISYVSSGIAVVKPRILLREIPITKFYLKAYLVLSQLIFVSCYITAQTNLQRSINDL